MEVDLIPFHCPHHGYVLATFPQARVQHRCGAECAPEGITPREHVRALKARRAARLRQRRKRDIAVQTPLRTNGPDSNEAPGESVVALSPT